MFLGNKKCRIYVVLWRFANAYLYRKNVRGNQYGRKEELYECEDCSGCPYAEKCKKTDKNRTVRINQELTSMHQEVIENLESIHGALLRMNRSIQAESTFGIMKNDRWYKRIVRRGIHSVKLEVNKIAARWPAKAVAQLFTFSKKGSDRIVPR